MRTMAVEFTRRTFFRGIAAVLATAEAETYAAAVGAGKPGIRFGVLSDIHIAPPELAEPYLKGKRKAFRPRTTELLEKALAGFDARGADAVVIAGDLADWGLNSQLKAVKDCWDRIFPSGRSKRDGRKVELLAVLGNHDVAFRAWTGWNGGNYVTEAIGDAKVPPEEIFRNDIPGNWKRIFGDEYAPVWCRTVKGYTFIGAHWNTQFYPTQSVPGLADVLSSHAAELKGAKPFFFVEHPQPRGTCLRFGASSDDGGTTELLSKWPNAVAFSGHSHRPLTDESNVWQGAFTSIGAATLDSLALVSGRENGARGKHWNHRYAMEPLAGRSHSKGETYAAHGQFVSVYDGFLEIERLDFVSGRPVGANWVVPVPAGKDSPFLYANRVRAARRPAPFPDGAAVTVRRTKKAVELEFPVPRQIEGCEAPMDYEVTAFVEEYDVRRVLFRRYVYPEGAFAAPADRPRTVKAVFRPDLFPKGVLIDFEVRARETFGNANEPIRGTFGRILARWSPRQAWAAYDAVTVGTLEGFTPGREPETDRFGGWKVPLGTAEGFFRVRRDGARWWLVDPDGNRFISKGLAVFRPGSSDRQLKRLKEQFGGIREWAEREIGFLKSQGFNSTGAWSWTGTPEGTRTTNRIPYTVIINALSEHSRQMRRAGRTGKLFEGRFHEHDHSLPFVFEPDFAATVDRQVAQAAAFRDDPYLIGYFIDNEIQWGNDILGRYLSELPPDHACRRAAQEWADRRKGKAETRPEDVSEADGKAFAAHLFGIYVETVAKALRKYDPNHLYLGCRFNTWKAELDNAEIFRLAGRYMDVVSVNHYGHWDPVADQIRKWEKWSGRPFLVTEFYTKGVDSGLRNTTGAGWQVRTQEDRGLFYENFTNGLIALRSCVGWHWFTYMDNDPTDLKTDRSNRDSNKGVVRWDFSRYEPLLAHMRALNAQVYNLTGFRG